MARKQSAEDRRRYEVLSRMLTDRQADIRNKLRSLREAFPTEASDVKDTEEQSMEDFVRGMDYALMEMESETLRRIDEALLRLGGGTYGLLRGLRRQDRRGPPQGPALRRDLPGLPGAGRGRGGGARRAAPRSPDAWPRGRPGREPLGTRGPAGARRRAAAQRSGEGLNEHRGPPRGSGRTGGPGRL